MRWRRRWSRRLWIELGHLGDADYIIDNGVEKVFIEILRALLLRIYPVGFLFPDMHDIDGSRAVCREMGSEYVRWETCIPGFDSITYSDVGDAIRRRPKGNPNSGSAVISQSEPLAHHLWDQKGRK